MAKYIPLTVFEKDLIRNYILKTGCSYNEAAEIFGVSASTIYKIMNNRYKINTFDDIIKHSRKPKHKGPNEDFIPWYICRDDEKSPGIPNNKDALAMLDEYNTREVFDVAIYSTEDYYKDDVDIEIKIYTGSLVGHEQPSYTRKANEPDYYLKPGNRVNPEIAWELDYGDECYRALVRAKTAEEQQRILINYRRKTK